MPKPEFPPPLGESERLYREHWRAFADWTNELFAEVARRAVARTPPEGAPQP